jgi:hypothetical protein
MIKKGTKHNTVNHQATRLRGTTAAHIMESLSE